MLRLGDVKELLSRNLIRIDGGTLERFAEVMQADAARWGSIIPGYRSEARLTAPAARSGEGVRPGLRQPPSRFALDYACT